MRQITTVERGEYSDFQILAVFENPADAEKFAADWNDENQPSWDMRAVVGTLDFYPAGAYFSQARVIDGEISVRTIAGEIC